MICETPLAIIGELKIEDQCHICEKPSPGPLKYCEECREKAEKIARKENLDLLLPGLECVLAHKGNEYLCREELLKLAEKALPKFDNPGYFLRTILNQLGSPCELNKSEWYKTLIELEGEELITACNNILKTFTYKQYNAAIYYFKNKIHYRKTGKTLPEESTKETSGKQQNPNFCYICNEPNEGKFIYCDNCMDMAKEKIKATSSCRLSENSLEDKAIEFLQKKAREKTKNPPPEEPQKEAPEEKEWNYDKPSGWTWVVTWRKNKYCPQCKKNVLFWSNTKSKRSKCSNCGITFKDDILEKCKEEAPESLAKKNNNDTPEEIAKVPSPEKTEQKSIKISEVLDTVQIRSLKKKGVEKLKNNIQKNGYVNFPILVKQLTNGGYKLLDGKHRLEAMKALGEKEIPATILNQDIDESEDEQIAIKNNEASKTSIPTTLCDYAEFIWKKAEQGRTQEEIAGILGWSRSKVLNYSQLSSICKDAWKMIDTTFDLAVSTNKWDDVSTIDTIVSPFTEGLLRHILPLSPDQQIELVQLLIENKINKKQFKTRAERYKTMNDLHNIAARELVDLGEEYLTIAFSEIERGLVTNEAQLKNLIKALREQWQKKTSIQLLQGDFYEKISEIADNSIDLILTDPPYNCSNDTILAFEDRKDISMNFFGEEDQLTRDEYLERIFIWAKEFTRILKDTGICIIFCQHKFLESIGLSFEAQDLQELNHFIWCKTNPAPKVRKNSLSCATEFALIFSKSKDHTFNWLSQKEMFNYFVCPICNGGSAERLKDENGETLHPTQKPEKLINHLMTIFSNRGDLVFDGFSGTGTTAAVAKSIGRKFIGFEKEEKFFSAAQKRLAAKEESQI